MATGMNSGVGETSYAKNSTYQKKVMLKVKPILEESISRLLYCTTFKDNLKVADLGCSSGPNALMIMYNIITTINNTKLSLNQDGNVVAVQIYLNDLFENDFNSIFKLLPNFYQMIKEKGDKVGACFVNGLPGSFYERLFPNNYIHFFHSSYSLHWLSQAAKDLNKGAKSLNNGSIYITITSPPIVYKAYFEQFQRDFKLFLKLRSDELKPGGVMMITLKGRVEAHETSIPEAIIGTLLKDMVLEGLVEEAELDSFNLPVYFPTMDEVKQIIETERFLILQTLKTFKIRWVAVLEEEVGDSVVDSNMRAAVITNAYRSVFEPLLAAQFGKDIMDKLFSRFAEKIAQLKELDKLEYSNLVLSMTKA